MREMLSKGPSKEYSILLPKSHYSNISVLPILFIAVLFLSACNTTLESRTEKVVPTATPQASVPTATPGEVVPPSPTPEEVTSVATPLGETPSADTGSTRTIYPDQLEGYIPNPYMGWQDTQRKNKRFFETVGYR